MPSRTLVSNAADPKQVKRAKQLHKLTRERELADLGVIAGTVQGRRFLWRLLCECAVFQQSFVPGQPDLSTFNEGRRRVGLGLMMDLGEIDPTLYHRMAQEAKRMEEAYTVDASDNTHVETDDATNEENES